MATEYNEKRLSNGHVEKADNTLLENGPPEKAANGNGDAHFGDNFNAIHVPTVHFDAKQEDRLYRKIDSRLLWILALLYLVAFLDRGK